MDLLKEYEEQILKDAKAWAITLIRQARQQSKHHRNSIDQNEKQIKIVTSLTEEELVSIFEEGGYINVNDEKWEKYLEEK